MTKQPIHVQIEAREFILSLLPSIPRSSSRQILSKYSKILASIASSQYPELWPHFIAGAVSSWSTSSEALAYTYTHTLVQLLEDCVDVDFNACLSSSRRQDILAGLQTQLEELVSSAYSCLAAYYSRTDNAFYAVLSKEILRMFVLLVTLIKPDDMCKPPHDISLVVLSLLESSTYSTEALDLLSVIAHTKLNYDLFTCFLRALPSVNYYKPAGDESESLIFHMSLTKSAYALLSTNIFEDYLLEKKSSPAAITTALLAPLTAYFEFCYSLLKHPSLRIALAAITHWVRILRLEALYSIYNIDVFLTALMETSIQRMARIPWADGEAVGAVNELDFEDREEFVEVYGALRSRGRDLLRLLAPRYMAHALAYLQSLLRHLLTQHAVARDFLDASTGGATPNSGAYIQWELFAYAVDGVAKEAAGLQAEDKLGAPEQSAVVQLMEQLLAVRLADPLLALEAVAALEHWTPLVRSSKAHLQAALTYLFAQLPPLCTHGDVCLSSRAAAALSSVCAKCVEAICSHHLLVWTCTEIQAVLAAGSELGEGLGTSLTEALLLLTTHMASAAASEVFASPQTLMQACLDPDKHSPVTRLRATLTSLLAIAKKMKMPPPDLPGSLWTGPVPAGGAGYSLQDLCTASPFARVWEAVLGGLVQALGCIHGTCAPALRMQLMATDVAEVYTHPSLLAGEKDSLPGGGGGDAEAWRRAGERLYAMRVAVYHLLGEAARHRALFVHPCL